MHATAGSVLLSSERVELIAPSRVSVRVALGHGFKTPYYTRKVAEEGLASLMEKSIENAACD